MKAQRPYLASERPRNSAAILAAAALALGSCSAGGTSEKPAEPRPVLAPDGLVPASAAGRLTLGQSGALGRLWTLRTAELPDAAVAILRESQESLPPALVASFTAQGLLGAVLDEPQLRAFEAAMAPKAEGGEKPAAGKTETAAQAGATQRPLAEVITAPVVPAPVWTPLVEGPVRSDVWVLQLGTGVARLTPGQLRLMARCWPVPIDGAAGEGFGAALAVELVPVIEGGTRERQALEQPAIATDLSERGLVLVRQRTAVSLTAGRSLVLAALPTSSGSPDEAGPEVDNAPTLGASLFGKRSQGRGSRPNQSVLVLTPQVPLYYRLGGAGAAAESAR